MVYYKDIWCSLSKKEMEFCTMWVMLYMSSLHLASSYSVILSPESIVTDAGTDSVNFTCTIQLEIVEKATEHWIIWLKDNIKIVDNDTVLINSAKYNVYGISSAEMVEYTQSLQVNDIEETDHGIYACTLIFTSFSTFFSSNAWLIIRNTIPQPICFTETREQQVMLVCTISPSDLPIILYWADNEGKILILETPEQNEPLTLLFSIDSESSNQWFVCGATIAFTYTNKCIIGNQSSTTITRIPVTHQPSDTVEDVIPTTTTHEITFLSPIISEIISDTLTVTEQKRKYTTSMKVTQGMSSSDDKNTMITTFAVAGVILMIVFIIMFVLFKKYIQKRKNEESESPEEGIDTHNGNQLTNIGLGDVHLDDQCSAYYSSAFETDMDDPVHFYESVDLKYVEKNQKHMAMDNNKKDNDFYPLEYNGYKKESVPTIRPKVEKPNKFKTDDMKDMVTSLSQNEGPNTNGDFHLMETNDMYVSADEVTITRRIEKADDMFNTACPPNEDDMEGNAVTSQNEGYIDDTYPNGRK